MQCIVLYKGSFSHGPVLEPISCCSEEAKLFFQKNNHTLHAGREREPVDRRQRHVQGLLLPGLDGGGGALVHTALPPALPLLLVRKRWSSKYFFNDETFNKLCSIKRRFCDVSFDKKMRNTSNFEFSLIFFKPDICLLRYRKNESYVTEDGQTVVRQNRMHKWAIPLAWVLGIGLAIPAASVSEDYYNQVGKEGRAFQVLLLGSRRERQALAATAAPKQPQKQFHQQFSFFFQSSRKPFTNITV